MRAHSAERSRHDSLADWAAAFPYIPLLRYVQSQGKHDPPPALLDALAAAYRNVRDLYDAGRHEVACAHAFLEMLVDRPLDLYCYDTYLGMRFVLGLADPDTEDFLEHRRRRLNQLRALLAELALLEARTYLGTEQRYGDVLPPLEVGLERVYATARAIEYFAPEASRQWALGRPPAPYDAPAVLEWLAAAAAAGEPDVLADGAHTAFLFECAAMPMSTEHDEYMFIRVVQAFELCFNVAVAGMADVVRRLQRADVRGARPVVDAVAHTLRGSGRLFRVLTTMSPERFLSFRPYTSGSSAVGSAQIKTMEILCRHPTEERVAGEAFSLVPQVVEAYRRGVPNVEDVLPAASAEADPADVERLVASLREFDGMWVGWKKAHFGIALHWLGAEKGTGGTDGIPYLSRYIQDRLFPYLPGVGEVSVA